MRFFEITRPGETEPFAPGGRGSGVSRAKTSDAVITVQNAEQRLGAGADICEGHGALAHDARGFTRAVEHGGATPLEASSASSGTIDADACGKLGVEGIEGAGACTAREVRRRGGQRASGGATSASAVALSGMRRPMVPASERNASGTSSGSVYDEGERTRPVRVRQLARDRGHVRAVAVEVVRASHEPGDGLAAIALLQVVEHVGACRRRARRRPGRTPSRSGR